MLECCICYNSIRGPAWRLRHVPENKICTDLHVFDSACIAKIKFCPFCTHGNMVSDPCDSSWIARQIKWIRIKYKECTEKDTEAAMMMPAVMVLTEEVIKCLQRNGVMGNRVVRLEAPTIFAGIIGACQLLMPFMPESLGWNRQACRVNGIATITGVALTALICGLDAQTMTGASFFLAAGVANIAYSFWKKDHTPRRGA